MAAEPARLLELAGAVADGQEVDWAAESGPAHDPDSELIAQLRLLARVAAVHRTGRAGDTDVPAPPEAWGALQIRARIGAGQFGTVYRAWDPRLEREVALKLLDGACAVDPARSSTTVAEGRLLARVSHPHVITVYGADQFDGRVGVWMELLSGSTLEDVFRAHGALSAREASLLAIDLCGALAAVHREGLVHRDLKAQNVMREDGGRIVLMDFGAGEEVASQAREGRLVGTPLYMAPELFAGARATPRTDIYSLGVLLFWLVTGTYPVPGRTPAEVREAIERGHRRRLRDERPDLAPAFVAVVERALAPDPSARYDTAGALEDALAAFVASRPDADRQRTTDRRRVWRLVSLALLVIVAGLACLWRFGGRPFAPAPALAGIRSIAVVPFANVSGNSQDDFFAAGLADLLVSRLGSIKAIRVRAQDAGRGTPQPGVPGVEGLVTGSVDRRGNQLRVNARLLQAGTNAMLWSDSYERPVDEAFALQGVIARDIAREIRVSLTEDERARLNRAYRPNALAQDEYLRARLLMHRVQRPALIEARRLLEHAVQLDPGYQLALAALARCYVTLQSVGALTPAEGAALARHAAEAALAIDDNAEAELALAHVFFSFDWNWQAADAAFLRALDLNPSLSDGRSSYSRFLCAAGRTQEALEQARAGIEIEPLSREMSEALAMALYYNRQYDEALAVITQASALGVQSPTIIGRIHSARGDHARALPLIAQAYEETRNPALLAEMGRLEALLGRPERAWQVLAELCRIRASGQGYLFPGDVAFVLAAVGARDDALQWLELAVEERANRVLWLRVDPRVDGLRSNPRFQRLLKKVGPS